MYIRAMVPVPGSNQAFALGQVYLSDKEFVLYRSGAAGAAWKIIKSLKRVSSEMVTRAPSGLADGPALLPLLHVPTGPLGLP